MTTFNRKVYSKLKKVPKGYVVTYKELAKAVGSSACRAVGKAMGENKDPETIPCYKVVKSDGSLGGYSLGVREKIKRLKMDGVYVKKNKVINFKSILYRF